MANPIVANVTYGTAIKTTFNAVATTVTQGANAVTGLASSAVITANLLSDEVTAFAEHREAVRSLGYTESKHQAFVAHQENMLKLKAQAVAVAKETIAVQSSMQESEKDAYNAIFGEVLGQL